MPRVFAYCRVSTLDQTTRNQRLEIKAAGFAIEARRLIEETISGSVAAKQRPGITKLIDRMEAGDALVVTKLDRLGRNAMDVRATVEELASSGVRLHCLALGGVDLTSAAGKMTMQVIAAVLELTGSADRALTAQARTAAVERLAAGIAAIAREFKTTRQTIMRARDASLKLLQQG
jgi:putative DNA-invertase from lambdoid prophage Rac